MTRKVLKFEIEHLDLFEWREEEYDMYNIGSDFINSILSGSAHGHVFTLCKDGRILLIGGIVQQSQKTGYCFTIFSKYAHEHLFTCARGVKQQMYSIMQDMELNRLTTYNHQEAELHHKWCDWMGFEREGKHPHYNDAGDTYYSYGVIRQWD